MQGCPLLRQVAIEFKASITLSTLFPFRDCQLSDRKTHKGECKYLTLDTAPRALGQGHSNTPNGELLERAVLVLGRREILCKKTVGALESLISKPDKGQTVVTDSKSMLFRLWISNASATSEKLERGERGDPLSVTFMNLRALQRQREKVDETVETLRKISGDKGVDPRLTLMLESFPIVSAIRRALVPDKTPFLREAAVTIYSGGLLLHISHTLGTILKIVDGPCEQFLENGRCYDCSEAHVAEPFLRMFGLIPDLKEAFELSQASAKTFKRSGVKSFSNISNGY